MGMAMIGAIASSAIATVTGFMGAEQQRTHQLAQASQLDAQAKATYQRANQAREVSEIEARKIERQKNALRRQYDAIRGRNAVNLAAGYVDATSGSAMDVAETNAWRFADDMAETSYAAALKRWEGVENQKALQFQAQQYDAQSSYLEKTSGNLLTSLLSASFEGARGFFGTGGAQALSLRQAPQTISTFPNLVNRQVNTMQTAAGVPLWRR